jgi:hypothetical protein
VDDLISIFDGIIKFSQNNSEKIKHSYEWKYCVALLNNGWKIKKYYNLSDAILSIIWEKNNKEVVLNLAFCDQINWYNWLEKNQQGTKK